MAFILSEQRDQDCEAAFLNYQSYLSENRHRLPSRAKSLIDSDWYFTFTRQSPHDAWLKEVTVSEIDDDAEIAPRFVTITIRLLGSYHDGEIIIRYPRIYSYSLAVSDASTGHGDWRYDEFRISERGRLIHEIEWWGKEARNWIIEADDVEYSWCPYSSEGGASGV